VVKSSWYLDPEWLTRPSDWLSRCIRSCDGESWHLGI
jgi:hypothetical protein